MGEDEVPPTVPAVVPSTGPPPPPRVVASTGVLAPVEPGKSTGESGLNDELPIATPSREVMKQYWSQFKRTKPTVVLASPAPSALVESPTPRPDDALPLVPASSSVPSSSVTLADPPNAADPTPADPANATPARMEPIPEPLPAEPVSAVPSSPMVSLASSLPEPETPVPTPDVALVAALTRATTVDMMPSTPTPAPATEAAPSASLSPAEAKAQEVLSSDYMVCLCVRVRVCIPSASRCGRGSLTYFRLCLA